MTWQLNEDISYCRLDSRLVFLDIRRDHYFQLSRTLEKSFLDYLKSPDAADVDIGKLAKYNLLSQATAESRGNGAPDIESPSRSVLETTITGGRIPTSVILDVFIFVAKMRWQLKTRHLKPILQALSGYRRTRVSLTAIDEAEVQQRLAEAATTFNRVRPYVPIETSCLIDSLSMVRFLAKRGLPACLIMGVACDPFSAHAWVQHGPLVLNDSVGNAQAYVPIRVI